ncbi:MAG: hypothetical protein ACRDV3_12730, partial [Acidothermaceae bacterium]
MSKSPDVDPGDPTSSALAEFFAGVRDRPASPAPEGLAVRVRDRIRRARTTRGLVASGAAFVVIAAVGLTAGLGFGGKQGSSRSPHDRPAIASAAVANSPPASSPRASATSSALSSSAAGSAALQAVTVDAPVVPWPEDVATYAVPKVLSDGRLFELNAIINPHTIVGIARPAATPNYGPYALVTVDPVSGKVLATLTVGDDSDNGNGAGTKYSSTSVSPDGVSADWVAWVTGREGDDGSLSSIVMSAKDLRSGKVLTLGRAKFGDTSDSAPVVGGDLAVWSDSDGLHIYSLTQHEIVRTLAINETEGWTQFAVHWPWLSYTVNGTYDDAGSPITPPVPHLLDVRNGADSVAPGQCDGSWCEVYGDIEGAQLSTVAITSQADPTHRREIASNLGRLGGFLAMADGLVMWNDVDPYAPAARQPAAGPPLLYESHDYIYDPSA